jgi:hypothetical protein
VKDRSSRGVLRCAIYTRVSTDQGLEQDFNSLDAQREASAVNGAQNLLRSGAAKFPSLAGGDQPLG